MKKEYFTHPKTCPSCNHPTEVEGKFLICPNDGCVALYLGNLQKWIVKNEIMDISFATIEKLYHSGKVIIPSHFYHLTIDDFIGLDGLGAKSGKKIIDQLTSKKEIDLPTFIGGLNMASFSNSQCEKLVKAGYDNLDKLFKLTEEDLCKIPGIKNAIAQKILNGLEQKKPIIQKLLDVGITVKKNAGLNIQYKSQKLSGMSFVFTGAIDKKNEAGERYTREDLQKMVVENGGENHTSVKKGTSFLVQADPSSSSTKTKKALELGTKILGENQFFKLLGE